MYIYPKEAKQVENSIDFLIQEYKKTGYNSKPVVLHSLNVAFYLLRYGYGNDVIIAAVLHDLIEDSEVTIRMIKNKFGLEIAELVAAASHDLTIKDKEERYQEMFRRTLKNGKKATILKCADIYNNSFYIKLVEDKNLQKHLIDKVKYFIDISEPIIGDEPVWQDLNDQYVKLKELLDNQQ